MYKNLGSLAQRRFDMVKNIEIIKKNTASRNHAESYFVMSNQELLHKKK